MARMAHFVCNEKGRIDGSEPGDQGYKGKEEVRISPYYAKNDVGKAWSWVLRARDVSMAERIAHNMELIVANSNIGYDQDRRMDMYNSILANGGDITKARGDSDCSAGVCAATALAGGNVSAKLATGGMLKAFKSSGQFDVLTDAKYIQSSDYLRRGDILLRLGHTAVMVDNGSKADNDVPTQYKPPKLPTGRTYPIVVDEFWTDDAGKEYGVHSWCRVRSGPSTDDDILGKAYKGERFDAYGGVEDWYLINYHGRPGYIYKNFVSEVEG